MGFAIRIILLFIEIFSVYRIFSESKWKSRLNLRIAFLLQLSNINWGHLKTPPF